MVTDSSIKNVSVRGLNLISEQRKMKSIQAFCKYHINAYFRKRNAAKMLGMWLLKVECQLRTFLSTVNVYLASKFSDS